MSKIKVLVVDDSSFMRTMLSRLIAKDARFEIVGTAENGQVGIEKTKELRPDVVTMDVEMPVMTGLDSLQGIMQQCPTPVVMISTLTENGAKITMEALEKGAVDFLPKALQDNDRNIFNAAEAIHDKLAAAAQAKVNNATFAAAPPAPAPVAPMPVAAGGSKFKVMLVGSSTGGPKALQIFLQGLPANFPLPIVVAQHMPPQFTPALAQRLNEVCPLRVVELQNDMALQVGTVYISPGGNHTRISGSAAQAKFLVSPDRGESVYKPSVSVLASSAQHVYQSSILAVMLTGMGDDGANEFAAIKRAGGHVIAQDEASCTVYGMPRALVEQAGATEALALPAIAGRVIQVVA